MHLVDALEHVGRMEFLGRLVAYLTHRREQIEAMPTNTLETLMEKRGCVRELKRLTDWVEKQIETTP